MEESDNISLHLVFSNIFGILTLFIYPIIVAILVLIDYHKYFRYGKLAKITAILTIIPIVNILAGSICSMILNLKEQTDLKNI